MATLHSAAFIPLYDRIQAEVDNGLVSAAQVAVGFAGEVIASRSFGDAADDQRFVIFSATKALVAMSLIPHLASGEIDLTTPVAAYLPEFGHHGKADVTVLQLLTMQGGFPYATIGYDQWSTSEGRRARFAEWTLDWPAGTRTEYHPISAHWVIAELIESFTGRPYVDVVNDRTARAAGRPAILGPDAVAAAAGVVPIRVTGEYPTDADGLAATFGRADLVPVASVGPELLLSINDPRVQAAGIPGGGGVASAADMAAIYQSFLHDREGVFSPEWRADAVGTVRNASVSVTDGVPANRTIAGYVSGHDGYHLHRWMPLAPRAFGHAGAGGQINWVDPDSGLSFSFLHDTLHMDPRVEFHRCAELNGLVSDLAT